MMYNTGIDIDIDIDNIDIGQNCIIFLCLI
jgi:hypothetical protein